MKKDRIIKNGYMFKDFNDYIEYAPFDKNHPMLGAFELIWNMARSPAFADMEEEGDEE